MPRGKQHNSLVAEANAFLRSINLCFDAEAPERISHFRPTAKSIPLINGIMGLSRDKAFLVVAPYGSGKSLTLTYLLHIIENRSESQETLSDIEKRIKIINPSLRKLLLTRRRTKKRGIVLPLHGYQGNLPKAIYHAAWQAIKRNKLGREAKGLKSIEVSTTEDVVSFLQDLKRVIKRAGLDRICIMWDETGRHLEGLISEGRAAELSDIQVLAEYASRSSDLPVTFAVTLHQSILHYAQQMTQSVRAEWQKISGRFETVQYVDDSKEIYRLITDIICANRGYVLIPDKKQLRAAAKVAKEKHGMFRDFTLTELSELFYKVYPSNPAAVFLLPRISARVAQNERTLFTFLYANSLDNGFSIADLYDYFSSAMRSDMAVGGTYKQWLETESAISKTTGDDMEVQALKSACLLGMGTKGTRSRVGCETLIWALKGYGTAESWAKTISNLVDKKLLLYRQHSEEVSVWHGTDVDLRGRLAEEKTRQRATFDVLDFLNQEAPPEAWKPVEYNTFYGTTRYWSGEYVLAKDFVNLLEQTDSSHLAAGIDGRIYYLLTENNDDLRQAERLAQSIEHPQLIFAVPSSPLNVLDAALEVWCLLNMQHNPELTGEDPLILPEIQHMLDDARAHLQSILDKLIKPGSNGPRWFQRGRELRIVDLSGLRRELTRITSEVFPDTPIIHNELINRHKPSGTIINSRKKLLMGMLERHGTDGLGLKPTAPEASMFRTILLHTGLYRQTPEGDWAYSSGRTNSLADNPGLKKVWSLLREFFEGLSDKSKQPADLFDDLLKPPFGIRCGLLPIFFAAGLKAFGKSISLRHNHEYVVDILPTVIEDLCRNPENYELEVIKLDSNTESYLSSVRSIFLGQQCVEVETDMVRATYDAIQSWLFQLPKASLTANNISSEAKRFQKLLLDSRYKDPLVFLLKNLPHTCGFDINQNGEVRRVIEPLKIEIENVSHTYVSQACTSIHQALSRIQGGRTGGVQKLAQQWASYFPETITSRVLPGIARSLLTRMKTSYDDETLFVNSLALLLVGRPIEDWDDSSAVEFENRIHELTQKIETTTLQSSSSFDLDSTQEVRDGLSYLVAERIKDMYTYLVDLVGEEKSASLVKNITKGNGNGHITRGSQGNKR